MILCCAQPFPLAHVECGAEQNAERKQVEFEVPPGPQEQAKQNADEQEQPQESPERHLHQRT